MSVKVPLRVEILIDQAGWRTVEIFAADADSMAEDAADHPASALTDFMDGVTAAVALAGLAGADGGRRIGGGDGPATTWFGFRDVRHSTGEIWVRPAAILAVADVNARS